MMLKRFGFFDEIDESERFFLLQARNNTGEDEDKILNYLKNGNRYITIPGITIDYLSVDEKIIGAPHIFTDGVWAWTIDVVYYIENYQIPVPKDFLAHMRNQNWKVRNLNENDFRNLEL